MSETRTPSTSGKEQLIKVCVRMKPVSKEQEECEHFWQIHEGRHLMNLRTKDQFTFDRAFPPNTTTEEIFHKEVKELVHATVDGFHSTVFAYGQTSSGKTFTMRGDTVQAGLIPESIAEVFQVIEQQSAFKDFEVHISYVQIYNEQLRDLLPRENEPNLTGRGLEIRESIKKGVFIKGLCLHRVYSITETLSKLEEGDRNRTFAETKLNTRSSRSHTIFRVHVKSSSRQVQETERGIHYKEAILSLVDLAGSEGVNRANTEGL